MRLLVGRIGRAHGIHGEATVEVRTDQPEDRFAIGARVQTDAHGELHITSHRWHNGILLLGFENILDRNAIEKFRDTLMYCDVDIDEPSEGEDDYHVLQLIGCKAYLESGEEFGTVADVINLPGQDLLAIDTATGEVLIPFVHQLVPVVDISKKRVTVIPPTIADQA
ncbi:MAG: ribosome maturation factor RimM [Candidatus Nanopelagicaceae bacterium]|nr:ribosome maturation factor RimM [Candidatus Nanopelagicaceae bacterium]